VRVLPRKDKTPKSNKQKKTPKKLKPIKTRKSCAKLLGSSPELKKKKG
jgi:hypothetical protein